MKPDGTVLLFQQSPGSRSSGFEHRRRWNTRATRTAPANTVTVVSRHSRVSYTASPLIDAATRNCLERLPLRQGAASCRYELDGGPGMLPDRWTPTRIGLVQTR